MQTLRALPNCRNVRMYVLHCNIDCGFRCPTIQQSSATLSGPRGVVGSEEEDSGSKFDDMAAHTRATGTKGNESARLVRAADSGFYSRSADTVPVNYLFVFPADPPTPSCCAGSNCARCRSQPRLRSQTINLPSVENQPLGSLEPRFATMSDHVLRGIRLGRHSKTRKRASWSAPIRPCCDKCVVRQRSLERHCLAPTFRLFR